MASKRSATSDLNHDNWDQEETPEEAGTFHKAPEDVLKKRVFKTAKRRITKSPEEGSLNVFNPANLAKFSSKPSQPANQMFGFLSKIQTDASKTNGVGEKLDNRGDGDKQQTAATFSFGIKTDKPETKTNLPVISTENNGTEKSKASLFSFVSGAKNESGAINTSSIFSFGNKSSENLNMKNNQMFSFANKQELQSSDNVKAKNLDNYYAKLKGLNQSVAKWINKHVESNPLINLQPIFKDYEKFFEEIEKERNKCDIVSESQKGEPDVQKQVVQTSTLSFSCTPKQTEAKVELPPSAATFKFGATTTSNDNNSTSHSTPIFSLGNKNTNTGFGGFSFGTTTSAPINFGSTPVSAPAKSEENKDEEESDEPPKVEVKQIEEEGHIYSVRCKVFVKKDGNFVEKGVGSLFLKPIPESDKVQLIVRAHNSLGNVLCNFILSQSIPTQRMGKNNVMVVCIPTPDSQPPPIPILIKVKTGEDADQLLETLEKHKK